jgi:hypothetical protein
MSPKIDPDQDAVYYAESLVFENTLFNELVTDADIQELADELFYSDWWTQNNLPVPLLRVRRLEATRSIANHFPTNSGRRPEIAFAAEQVNPWTLAHEAAHIAQYELFQSPFRTIQSHGPEFRTAYVAVADVFCGRQAAWDLMNSFTTHLPARSNVAVHTALTSRDEDPEGIFPRWRLRQQLTEIKRFQPAPDPIRINGAIAL